MNDSPQVALVCDSKKVREALAGYLRGAEYDVTMFEDDRAYWQQVSVKTIPDLLVLDVSASMANRDELLPQTYQSLPKFPILALSNPVTDIDQSVYPDSMSWLTKPVRRGEFLEHIQARVAHESAQTDETSHDETAKVSGSTRLKVTGTGHHSGTDLTGLQTPGGEQTDSPNLDNTHSVQAEADDARLSQLQARIKELEAKVDSLQESRGENESLAELEGEVCEVSEDVSSLSDHIGALYDRIGALEESFNQIQGTIQNLNAGLETLTNEQVGLADEVESVTREQAEVRSEVDDLLQWQRNISMAFDSVFEED